MHSFKVIFLPSNLFRSQFICELIAVFVLVSIANIWLLLPTFAMGAVCYGLRYVYINTARSVKRVDSLSK